MYNYIAHFLFNSSFHKVTPFEQPQCSRLYPSTDSGVTTAAFRRHHLQILGGGLGQEPVPAPRPGSSTLACPWASRGPYSPHLSVSRHQTCLRSQRSLNCQVQQPFFSRHCPSLRKLIHWQFLPLETLAWDFKTWFPPGVLSPLQTPFKILQSSCCMSAPWLLTPWVGGFVQLPGPLPCFYPPPQGGTLFLQIRCPLNSRYYSAETWYTLWFHDSGTSDSKDLNFNPLSFLSHHLPAFSIWLSLFAFYKAKTLDLHLVLTSPWFIAITH